MLGFRRFLPDPRWWDTHGHELPLGGEGKRQLMVLRFGMRVPYPVEQVTETVERVGQQQQQQTTSNNKHS